MNNILERIYFLSLRCNMQTVKWVYVLTAVKSANILDQEKQLQFVIKAELGKHINWCDTNRFRV